MGLGRNVDTFDYLRLYAYREVRLWYGQRKRGVFVSWLNHLHHVGLNFTANEHPTPLDSREVHHIAKSVARWVWRRFSADRFSTWQSAQGRAAGESREPRSADY